MELKEFLNQDKITDLSFFNFSNAVTAAYFANRNLEVLKVNDNFVNGMIHLARVYMANYDYSEAIKWCKKAIQINERYSFAHNCLGEIYYLQKKYDEDGGDLGSIAHPSEITP